MTLGDKRTKIQPGDYVFIPKGTKHSVKVKVIANEGFEHSNTPI